MIDEPRGTNPEEMDKLCELVGEVFGSRMCERFPTLFCEENADNLRIIKTDGRIVSHIGVVVRDMIIKGCRISVGNVGAVCTHEEYRKRGYAWMILEDLIKKLRSDGVDMLLVSGSRSLYIKHGCTHVGKVRRYLISEDIELPKTNLELRLFSLEDLPSWVNIYTNEPVRFHRPYDDFRKLTLDANISRKNRSLYSILDEGCPVAYAVLDINHREKDEFVSFNEYAGSRGAIVESLRLFRNELGIPNITIPVSLHDIELARLLDSKGLEPGYSSTGGTITIINFPQLCKKLMPLFEEIIGSMAKCLSFDYQEGVYKIYFNGDNTIFDDAHDVARLIFGYPPDINEHNEFSTNGELIKILKTIFPIPRPEYGLSYI